MILDDLKSLLIPPARPRLTGTSDTQRSVEVSVRISLPDDYKEFVSAYGVGHVDGYLGIASPFADADGTGLGIENILEEEQDRHRELRRQLGRDVTPYPVFPAAGGLFPWGRDTNGGTFYWVTGHDDSNRWPVFEYQDGTWSQFDGTMSEFLFAVLSGAYESAALGSPFPSTKPTYFDPWWEQHSVEVELSIEPVPVQEQIEVVRSIFDAAIRYEDPDSSEDYTSVNMIVRVPRWRLRYWANRQSAGYVSGITLELPHDDLEDAKRLVFRCVQLLSGRIVSSQQSDLAGRRSIWGAP